MSAAVGCCGALVALSFTQEEQLWQQFITQGVLFGYLRQSGYSLLFYCSTIFPPTTALAMGIIAGGSSIAGI